jgi:hypothetical protein
MLSKLAGLGKLQSFVLLLGLAVLVRLDTLPISDVEYDESVYFLMAKSMVQQHAPYTVIWDHKPPGIYAIYYVALSLLGVSTVSVRLFACLATALSAFAALDIYQRLRPGGGWQRFLPALLVLLSFRKNGGEGANTEVFFVPAASWALLLLLSASEPLNVGARRRWRLFFAGCAAGVAFWIKFNTLLEIQLAGACAVLWLDDVKEGRLARVVEATSLAAIGFVAVALVAVVPFVLTDNLEVLTSSVIDANVRHVGRRMGALAMFTFVVQVVESSLVLWTLCLAGVLARVGKSTDQRSERSFWFLLVWLLAASASALAPGQPYSHYALETVVPLCVLSSVVFTDLFLAYLPEGRIALSAAAFLLLAGAGTNMLQVGLNLGREIATVVKQRSFQAIDTSRAVAAHIRASTRGGGPPSVYVVDAQPILYHLLDVVPPTKYAFPPFLIDPHFERVTGSDARAEVDRLLAQKPEFMVRRTDPLPAGTEMLAYIKREVEDEYVVERKIHNLEVLHRVDGRSDVASH